MAEEGVVELRKKALEAWREAREYLESGGDVTYAYLKLALSDVETAAPLIKDPYCRRQVEAEASLLRHALKLAMVAYEWSLGVGGRAYKLRLFLRAVKESIIILLLQLKRL